MPYPLLSAPSPGSPSVRGSPGRLRHQGSTLSRRVPREPVHLDLAPAVRPIHRPRAALHELPLSAFSSGCVVLPRFPRHRYAFGMEQTTRHRRGCHLGRTRYPVFLLERHGSHPSFPARSRRATSAGSMLGWSSLVGTPETALSETRRRSCDAAKEAVRPASQPTSQPSLPRALGNGRGKSR